MAGLNLANPLQSLETSPLVANNNFYPSPTQHANNGYELASIDESRAIAEVQSSMIIAKRFPRNEFEAYNKIMNACKRIGLAKNATYAYPRGGKTVTGPSIRLAEVLANNWGNIDYGYREVGSGAGYTDVEAYAFDKENNTRSCRSFRVLHIRSKRQGNEALTDPRDIYELIANQASRRIRSCILQIIPGDLVESALNECMEALKKEDGGIPLVDRVRKMASSFQSNFGITTEMIEKRLGHKLEATIDEELVQLRSIFTSLKDGASKRESFFDLSEGSTQEGNETNKSKEKPNAKSSSPESNSKKEAPTAKAPTEAFNASYTVICPNTGKEIDEIDCVNKPCRKGCPAFE